MEVIPFLALFVGLTISLASRNIVLKALGLKLGCDALAILVLAYSSKEKSGDFYLRSFCVTIPLLAKALAVASARPSKPCLL